jgi:hypothetical protein
LRGPLTSRPSPDPRQPLKAKQTSRDGKGTRR